MKELKKRGQSIRLSILNMIYNAQTSHIGSCFSVVDILNILYAEVLDIDPRAPKHSNRDYLIFSKGHAAAALYATLACYGFFPIEELTNYCQDNSRLAGHITRTVPGVEFSTGSLGHGLPVACGIALASKKQVYVIMSDGECDEGAVWEAALFAPHHRLLNLTLIIDYNKLQSLGRVNEVLSLEPLASKWKAFNWNVLEVNGHNYSQLLRAFHTVNEAPKVIIAHTIKGKGVSFMEDSLLWHYRSPDKIEYLQARDELLLPIQGL